MGEQRESFAAFEPVVGQAREVFCVDGAVNVNVGGERRGGRKPLVGEDGEVVKVNGSHGVEVCGGARGQGVGDGDFDWAGAVEAVVVGGDCVEFCRLTGRADCVDGKSDLAALAGIHIRVGTGFRVVVGVYRIAGPTVFGSCPE